MQLKICDVLLLLLALSGVQAGRSHGKKDNVAQEVDSEQTSTSNDLASSLEDQESSDSTGENWAVIAPLMHVRESRDACKTFGMRLARVTSENVHEAARALKKSGHDTAWISSFDYRKPKGKVSLILKGAGEFCKIDTVNLAEPRSGRSEIRHAVLCQAISGDDSDEKVQETHTPDIEESLGEIMDEKERKKRQEKRRKSRAQAKAKTETKQAKQEEGDAGNECSHSDKKKVKSTKDETNEKPKKSTQKGEARDDKEHHLEQEQETTKHEEHGKSRNLPAPRQFGKGTLAEKTKKKRRTDGKTVLLMDSSSSEEPSKGKNKKKDDTYCLISKKVRKLLEKPSTGKIGNRREDILKVIENHKDLLAEARAARKIGEEVRGLKKTLEDLGRNARHAVEAEREKERDRRRRHHREKPSKRKERRHNSEDSDLCNCHGSNRSASSGSDSGRRRHHKSKRHYRRGLDLEEGKQPKCRGIDLAAIGSLVQKHKKVQKSLSCSLSDSSSDSKYCKKHRKIIKTKLGKKKTTQKYGNGSRLVHKHGKVHDGKKSKKTQSPPSSSSLGSEAIEESDRRNRLQIPSGRTRHSRSREADSLSYESLVEQVYASSSDGPAAIFRVRRLKRQLHQTSPSLSSSSGSLSDAFQGGKIASRLNRANVSAGRQVSAAETNIRRQDRAQKTAARLQELERLRQQSKVAKDGVEATKEATGGAQAAKKPTKENVKKGARISDHQVIPTAPATNGIPVNEELQEYEASNGSN